MLNFITKILILFASLLISLNFSFAAKENNASKANSTKDNTVADLTLKKNVKVALVPFKIEGNQTYDSFWKKIVKNVEDAQKNNADIVVFPELLTADLVDASEKTGPLTAQFKVVAEKYTPLYIEDIKKLAKDKKINIIAGSTPRLVGKNIMNTALLATAEGRLETQDKVYLTPDEKDWGWTNGEKLKVIDTQFGRIAILICYDAEFPQISHELAALNPEVLFVPSMTDTIEGFRRVRWTAQARAIEHRAYVLHVGTTGQPDPSWPHWAQASALSPSEKGFPGLIVEGQVNSSEIVKVELDLQKLRDARAKRGIHPSKDQTDRKLHLKMSVI
jgi:predicted amidohydrolase